jgi:hypothetical protein
LTAPYKNTWYSVRCPSFLIRQTLLDPLNFQEVIGVVLEGGVFGERPIFYKTITNEARLSKVALQLRALMPFSCFYFANFEHDLIEDAPGWVMQTQFDKLIPTNTLSAYEWSRLQRRGEPFFATWGDLFNQLVEVLWAMLDKTKSWGAFNYKFQIDTSREASNIEESVAIVKRWQDAIGTPDMNSAVYTDQTVDVQPMSFPMQSTDIKEIMDLMFQLTGLSGNVPPHELGANLNTTFATARTQGGPQQQFSINIQTDIEDMLVAEYTNVIKSAIISGIIPREEVRYIEELHDYGIKILSPEISKKDIGENSAAYKTYVESLLQIMGAGLHTPESIAVSLSQISKELAGVDVIVKQPDDDVPDDESVNEVDSHEQTTE